MDWLRNNYDKAILAAACLLLLVCCALIIVRARTFPERFAGRDSSQPIDNTIKALPADAIRTKSLRPNRRKIGWVTTAHCWSRVLTF